MNQTTLYAKSSKDKTKQWSIQVNKHGDGTASIVTFHGEKGGTLTEQSKRIVVGKNIGKANETSPYDQAVNEAESKIQKKRDKGYFDTESAIIAPVLPMLAHKYAVRGHDILWPAYVQPKLNGVRCMAHQTPVGIELLSRKGKIFNFSHHIRAELTRLFNTAFTEHFGRLAEFYLDGELFLEGMPLQDIVRATRKQSGDIDRSFEAGIEYHIYDCFELDTPGETRVWAFNKRFKFVQDIIRNDGNFHFVKAVYTKFVTSPDQALKEYEIFLSNGFEGGMLRNVVSDYKLGHRSADLQKIKQFFDAEYEIIGAFEGTGTEAGLVNWICKTPEGREFNVRPRGTFDDRAELWKNHKKYVGKMLTVTYQEMSKDNIPHICVGTGIRDYE